MSNLTPSNQSGFNREEQINSDRFINLQGQISQCLDERRQLIDSRNFYIKATIASWIITLVVIFVFPGIREGKLEEQRVQQQARILATEKRALTEINCPPSQSIPAMLEANKDLNPREYLDRISQKLETPSSIASIDYHPERYEPETKVEVPTETETEIKRRLYSWTVAWELQDIDAYLKYYSLQFQADDGSSYLSWREQRKERISKPEWIKIRLSDVAITKFDGSSATLEFEQRYSAPGYSDVSKKKLNMMREEDEWRIVREANLDEHRVK